MQSKLEPKLLTVLREGYSRELFLKDLTAGVLVGIVALPLAIAFAIASGVQPEQGLYTAVIAGFFISLLSGSRVQIGGPTGAFIVIVYGIVQKYGYEGLATATFMAGGLLLLMGFSRLGSIIKFIPYPVTVGFTSGIALIIAAGQVRDFLGLTMDGVPSEFLEKLFAYQEHLSSLNFYALGLGVLSIFIILFWPRVTHRLPGSLIALIVTTALVHAFELPVETIGSRYGSVPQGLPRPHLPSFSWPLLQELFLPALSIALLAGIESLLSAVVADGMTGRRHRSNMELVAQGVANLLSPIFGGIPATGAIARTATNIKNGGRTPVSGMVHAFVLLLIMLFLGQWAALIPMATLAGILMVVSYNMSEWRLFVKLFHGPRSDVLVLVITFGLTVLLDLTVAIQVGIVLAALLFMQRMAQVTQIGLVTQMLSEDEDDSDPNAIGSRDIPEGVEVFEIDGPFFFGAADKFKNAITRIERPPKVLILRLRKVLTIDATGLMALEEFIHQTVRSGTHLICSGTQEQTKEMMEKAGLLKLLGAQNFFETIDEALEHASERLQTAAPPSSS